MENGNITHIHDLLPANVLLFLFCKKLIAQEISSTNIILLSSSHTLTSRCQNTIEFHQNIEPWHNVVQCNTSVWQYIMKCQLFYVRFIENSQRLVWLMRIPFPSISLSHSLLSPLLYFTLFILFVFVRYYFFFLRSSIHPTCHWTIDLETFYFQFALPSLSFLVTT